MLRADDRLVEDVVDVLRARPSSVSSMGIVFQDVVDVPHARREGRTHCVSGVSRWGRAGSGARAS